MSSTGSTPPQPNFALPNVMSVILMNARPTLSTRSFAPTGERSPLASRSWFDS